ncbi:MAG: hypothetical protein JW996_03005 [Candidatus Cloacimonetes bacterium]|nr:hypothetical protein [Candidatus Cloacimonadota bacterium]
MFLKRHSRNALFLMILLIPLLLFSDESADETIIAEYDGGKITLDDLEFRISKIAPMYQAKYKTNDGKLELLDMICTEELFYLESINSGFEAEPEFWNRIQINVKNTFNREFKKDYVNDRLNLVEDEKRQYFQEHKNTDYADRTYEEVEHDIEMRLLPQKQEMIIDNLLDSLYLTYEIEVDNNLIKSTDFDQVEPDAENLETLYLRSSDPSFQRSVKDFKAIYDELPTAQKDQLKHPEFADDQIKKIVHMEIIYEEALRQGYDEKEEVAETVDQIKKNMLLRTVYNELVINQIDISDEDLKDYYENNITKFSSNAFRKIQTFAFKSQEEADKMREKVVSYLKKDNHEAISKLIEESSLYPHKNGEIDHIYQNGIIPGIGKDDIYSEMVWEKKPGKTDPKKLSKIFVNSKDEYVFFRILEDNIAEPTPFVEIVDKVRAKMEKDLTQLKFEEVTQQLEEKYNLIKYPERVVIILSAEEYFRLAEEAQKKRRFHDAVFHYDQIIKYYNNSSDDYKAAFMKAFLYAEELKEKSRAITLFEEFLDTYPRGELHDSAEFMLEELRGNNDILNKFE